VVVQYKEPVSSVSTGPVLGLRLDRAKPLARQIEAEVRALVRAGSLPIGAALPSTRALAADVGVSRGVVVGAYAQLAAEGFIALRRGAPPVVAVSTEAVEPVAPAFDVPIAGVCFNLRPDLPDLSRFPRADWVRACQRSLHDAPDHDLAYGEPIGATRLRALLVPFLARLRGVVATQERMAVFSGSTQALFTIASALRELGARRIAVEDPGHRWRTRALKTSGLDVVAVPAGMTDLPDADALVVSPEHQFPTGAVLPPERRRALVDWATRGDRIVIEHDYDGLFRYDRQPLGALQALAPEHVAYVGSASPLLAPSVRLGWAVLPARILFPVGNRMFATAISASRLSELALAQLIESGALDRHLRRARAAYRRRREVLARAFPVTGAPAGLFVGLAVRHEAELLAALRDEGFALDGVNEHTLTEQPGGVVLGFAASAEPTLERAAARIQKLYRSSRR
jgi:GntR family transcriptional regulator/MocR family aminotransferase